MGLNVLETNQIDGARIYVTDQNKRWQQSEIVGGLSRGVSVRGTCFFENSAREIRITEISISRTEITVNTAFPAAVGTTRFPQTNKCS